MTDVQQLSPRAALLKKIGDYAEEISQQNSAGALHIFVEDANCSDEHLDMCLNDPNITPEEVDLVNRIRNDLDEDFRYTAVLLSGLRGE